MRFLIFILGLCFSLSSLAGAFKCTDENGKTTYQSKPCEEKNDTVEIDLKTGTVITHEMELKLQEMQLKKEQEDLEKQQQLEKLIADTETQSDLNQTYIKQHRSQFSAFAIPPYTVDNFPEVAQPFKYRLPEIERYRRLGAVYVLNQGQCGRVEASELSGNSSAENLVFTIDCRTGRQINVEERILIKAFPEINKTP